MKKIKVFTVISFLLVLAGCKDVKEIDGNKTDNKDYFLCIEDNLNENYEAVLVIDTNQRQIEFDFISLTWDGYSKNESNIYARYQGEGYDNVLLFNFVSGSLSVTLSNYREDSLKEYNGVTSYYFKCKKTKPML